MSNWSYEGMLAQPIAYLNQPGNYLLVTFLTQTLVIEPGTYGAILSIPYACNVLQLFAAPFLLQRWNAKLVFLFAIGCTIGAWMAAAALILLVPKGEGSPIVLLFVLSYAVSSLCTSVSSVAWTHWVHREMPGHAWGRYFARRNRLLQAALFFYILSAMMCFRSLGTIGPVFAGIFLFAGASRISSLVFAVRNPPPPDPHRSHDSFWAQWRELRTKRRFLNFVLLGAWWGGTANLAAPFIPVYFLRELHWPSGEVGLYFVASLLAGAFAFPVWGRVMNRYGPRAGMLAALTAWAGLNLAWFSISKLPAPLIFGLGATIGAANAGMVLGSFHLMLMLAPPRAGSLAIGLNTAATAVATAVAPLAAGAIIDACAARAAGPDTGYQILFTLQLATCAGAAWVLHALREPTSPRLWAVIGGMTNLRTLGAVLGLGFLVDYVFSPPRAPRVPASQESQLPHH